MGMGVGLAIVKKILDLHQVAIYVKSTPGKGTTFGLNYLLQEQTYMLGLNYYKSIDIREGKNRISHPLL
jgi:K+-sensing histidine kinase KdpD